MRKRPRIENAPPAHLSGHGCHLAHHPKGVLTEDLLDVLIGVTALHEPTHEIRDLRYVFHPLRQQIADPVEVGPAAHVIDPDDSNGVVEVIQEALERDTAESRDALGVDLPNLDGQTFWALSERLPMEEEVGGVESAA